MSKPQEFWIARPDSDFTFFESTITKTEPNTEIDIDFKNAIHVREVVEITDEDIWRGMDTSVTVFDIENPINAFEAGARWAIAKLTGADNE